MDAAKHLWIIMYEPLLRNITENPFDDGPRLVMADYLEEQGDSDRAEFIRIQVELHGRKRPRACSACEGSGRSLIDGTTIWDMMCRRCKGKGFVGGNFERWELVKREAELLEGWIEGREGSNCKWWLSAGGVTTWATPKAEKQHMGCHGGWWCPKKHYGSTAARFERGFVGKIRLTMEVLLREAEWIFKTWPVTEVEVFGRKPIRELWHVLGFSWLPMDGDDSPESMWIGNLDSMNQWTSKTDPHVLPWQIFDLAFGLRTKNVADTDEDCMVWLSRACVKYGREKAGLGVLKWPS
jgi:uncharacterized protein (TIGR02996 family)